MVSVSLGLIIELEYQLNYVNDFSNGPLAECKLFADDTSLFSVSDDFKTSAHDINKDI